MAAKQRDLPDVRDGLTRLERLVLLELERAQHEFGTRPVPSAVIYGRVCEQLPVSPQEFQHTLTRLVGRRRAPT